MALKVKSSSLFFYPMISIKVHMKYTSNFKVGNHINLIKKKGNKKRPKGNKRTNRITGHYFLYNVFRALTKVSLLSKKDNTSSLTNISISDVSFFSIKQGVSHYTILRAPYRYKKGRYQVGYSRVRVNVSLRLLIPSVDKNCNSFASLTQTLNLLPLLVDVLIPAGTNIVTLDKLRLLIPLQSPNLFKISNYRLLGT